MRGVDTKALVRIYWGMGDTVTENAARSHHSELLGSQG